MSSATVSVESLSEYKVNEIELNGVEIQEKPLNPSEHFKQLVNRIDFFKRTDDRASSSEDDDQHQQHQQKVSEPPMEGVDPEKRPGRSNSSTWPWKGVRAQVSSALQEVCALTDVLRMCRERQYLMLDSVASDQVTEAGKSSRQTSALLGKRRALQSAVAILNSGAERMSSSTLNSSVIEQHNFHTSLLGVRRRWRLRRLGDAIVGDLSYRCVGSRYNESGTFEVRRVGGVLRLHLPGHLEGETTLRVELGAGLSTSWEEELSSAVDPSHSTMYCPPESIHDRLRRAQNNLWINELFAQLRNEAAKLATQYSVVTCGRKMFATLFPGVQLVVSVDRKEQDSGSTAVEYCPPLSSPLVLHLQEMLRQVHRRTCRETAAHPVTAPAGLPAARMAAGPGGMHRSELMARFSDTGDSLLVKFMEVARHAWLHRAVAGVLEEEVQRSHDPVLLVHWCPLQAKNKSQVKVDIISPGHESCRTGVLVTVDSENITVIYRDGRLLTLGTDVNELRAAIRRQMLHHHVTAVQQFTLKPLGWQQVLPVSMAAGSGATRDLGAAALCLVLVSPDCRYTAVVHAGPTHGVRLLLGPSTPENTDADVMEFSGTGLRQVDLQRVKGSSTASKIEGVLSCFTPLVPTNSPF